MYFQTFDILTINNKNVKIGYEPLESYLNKLKINPKFIANRLQLGHVFNGKWELIDNKLYLLDVKCTNEHSTDANSIFISAKHPKIFADWFNDRVVTYEGKLIENSNMPLYSLCEINTFMEFEHGILVYTETVKNKLKVYSKKVMEEPDDDLPF